MNSEKQTFIIIPDLIQRNDQIDWPHRAIWGIIYAFSSNGGECWLSVEQIAERIHRKRRQTSSMITQLLELELIEIASWNGRKRSLRVSKKWMQKHDQSLAWDDARNSAHVQSAAQQTGNEPHTSHAEIRTAAKRQTAHIEKREEKKKEKKKENNTNSGQKPKSIDECREYFESLGSNDGDAFWDYWASVGWKRKTGKIVCWKATARSWVRRNKNTNGTTVDKTKPFNANDAFNWAKS